ncbi:MAG: hypothetical protein AAF571_00410 [Verrucomicrobiota bacterium]
MKCSRFLILFGLLVLVSVPAVMGARGGLKGVSSVVVHPKVKAPGYLIYFGTTDAVLSGLWGMAPGMEPDKEGRKLERLLEGRGFSITKTFLKDFQQALRNSEVFSYKGSSGTPKAYLYVTRYGVGVAPTGFKRLKPVIEGEISIVDANGDEMYYDMTKIDSAADSVRGASYDEYVANSAQLEKDLRVLSQMLAERLVTRMERKSGSKAGSSATTVTKKKQSKYRSK